MDYQQVLLTRLAGPCCSCGSASAWSLSSSRPQPHSHCASLTNTELWLVVTTTILDCHWLGSFLPKACQCECQNWRTPIITFCILYLQMKKYVFLLLRCCLLLSLLLHQNPIIWNSDICAKIWRIRFEVWDLQLFPVTSHPWLLFATSIYNIQCTHVVCCFQQVVNARCLSFSDILIEKVRS